MLRSVVDRAGQRAAALSGVLLARFMRRIGEHSENVPGQVVLDLAVPRDRLRNSGGRISRPIVPAAVSDEDASEPLDGADQIAPLHGITISSILRMPDNSPLVKSR
jgi:hypothetical protein